MSDKSDKSYEEKRNVYYDCLCKDDCGFYDRQKEDIFKKFEQLIEKSVRESIEKEIKNTTYNCFGDGYSYYTLQQILKIVKGETVKEGR